ncbi:TonB-dependent receptor, partial [bacterium]|nr:TonB-dependent receptor [bacterium]
MIRTLNKSIKIISVACSLALLVLAAVVQAGDLRGTVTDEETGQPVANANVTIPGTYFGAATNLDGVFYIRNIPSSAYDVRVSCLGYTEQIIGGVQITVTGEKALEIELKPTVLSAGQEVVVIGEKPLIEVDDTASRTRVGSKEIENLVVEDVQDLLANQLGVSKENNEIHIRGGRADENLYRIDGLSIKDPISGSGYGIYLSADAIEELEVITGGFNAE